MYLHLKGNVFTKFNKDIILPMLLKMYKRIPSYLLKDRYTHISYVAKNPTEIRYSYILILNLRNFVQNLG